MKILGIDYGRSKIGLAIGIGLFAEPFKVIRVDGFEDAIKKVLQVLQVEQVDKVIVGVSEGEMGAESKKFAKEIGAITFDETLTSKDAQKLSIEAGISRKKRHQMEDAFAASITLQNYLDSLEP
jgi:putative Holliday junction resolvase